MENTRVRGVEIKTEARNDRDRVWVLFRCFFFLSCSAKSTLGRQAAERKAGSRVKCKFQLQLFCRESPGPRETVYCAGFWDAEISGIFRMFRTNLKC